MCWGDTEFSEPVAIVDWDPGKPRFWHIVEPGIERSVGIYFYVAVAAMAAAEKRVGRPLRWHPAGPHTFHGYAAPVNEHPYESELP